MKNIVLFGAGKSATHLIDFLLKESAINNWKLIVCDSNLGLAQSKIGNAPNAVARFVDVHDDDQRRELVQSADIIISLLPADLHFIIAKDCVAGGKNLLTASYIDENINTLRDEIDEKGLLFLCEMGLDPGIDHMSAMKLITAIKSGKGKITSFVSHCGGLVAPESDVNPWHYKISWNPRNVVVSGKDGATFIKDDKIVDVPYHKVFRNAPLVNVPGLEPLAWYPNRNSLPYLSLYNLEDISTFIRTTLRHPSFCRGWHKLISVDCTSTKDYEQIKHCTTFKEWYDTKVMPYVSGATNWTNYLQLYITDPYKNEFTKQLNFFGYNTHEPLPDGFTCSADLLQHTLEAKLNMNPEDKDMVVMLHEIEYEETGDNGEPVKKEMRSCLVLEGEDSVKTAMSKCVGMPIGIAAKLILQNKLTLTGLHIPVLPDIYEPILTELEHHGIAFSNAMPALVAG